MGEAVEPYPSGQSQGLQSPISNESSWFKIDRLTRPLQTVTYSAHKWRKEGRHSYRGSTSDKNIEWFGSTLPIIGPSHIGQSLLK